MLTLSQKLPDYFEYYEDGTQYYLRQVQYPQDIPLLHQWMHEPHVIPQWQLNKSELELQVYFDKMLADDHQRLLIVGVDGKDVGYTEIYEGKRDRLGRYYEGDDNDLGWHLLFGDKSVFGKGFLRPTIRLLSFYIFENSPARKIVGEPDHTVKPYAAVVADLCYESQCLIPMPEKTAMLYYCFRETFYDKFGEYYTASKQQHSQQQSQDLSLT